MNQSTMDTILSIVQADNSISQQQIGLLQNFLKRLDSPAPEAMITSKAARLILGAGEGKPVSQPYLRSLVEQGRLNPTKISARKTRYNKNEVLGLLNMGGAR